jgi:hypothetical protein
MELKKYKAGKVYLRPDGAQWIFLGYYLEMPVWKIEGKYQTENDNDEVNYQIGLSYYLNFILTGIKYS